jgi:hypothetical protein
MIGSPLISYATTAPGEHGCLLLEADIQVNASMREFDNLRQLTISSFLKAFDVYLPYSHP